jgi:hypothetical protein
MSWASENDYNNFIDKILVDNCWPSYFIVYFNETNMFGVTLKRYPLEIHGGNDITKEKLSSCLFGYINDALFNFNDIMDASGAKRI